MTAGASGNSKRAQMFFRVVRIRSPHSIVLGVRNVVTIVNPWSLDKVVNKNRTGSPFLLGFTARWCGSQRTSRVHLQYLRVYPHRKPGDAPRISPAHQIPDTAVQVTGSTANRWIEGTVVMQQLSMFTEITVS